MFSFWWILAEKRGWVTPGSLGMGIVKIFNIYIPERTWVFITNSNVLILISQQLDGANLFSILDYLIYKNS